MNKASKSEGTPFAGLVRWLGGLAAHVLNQSRRNFTNAFQPVRLPLFLPSSQAAAPKLTGVAVCSITAPSSFSFCQVNHIHGSGLPFVCFIVADDKRNGGDLAKLAKRFSQG